MFISIDKKNEKYLTENYKRLCYMEFNGFIERIEENCKVLNIRLL